MLANTSHIYCMISGCFTPCHCNVALKIWDWWDWKLPGNVVSFYGNLLIVFALLAAVASFLWEIERGKEIDLKSAVNNLNLDFGLVSIRFHKQLLKI